LGGGGGIQKATIRKCEKQTIQKFFSVTVKPILFIGTGIFGVKK